MRVAAVERDTGSELRYLGAFHFALESGHAMNNEHAALARIALDVSQRADAIARVEQVFAWFERWTHELLAFARGRGVKAEPEPAAAGLAPDLIRQPAVMPQASV